ncbi:ATP-binding protein [Streptomyces tsukubensis]|nr:ATP-binding protein [Streptomyces tsukubensis]
MTGAAAVPPSSVPFEPLRHAVEYTGEAGCIAEARSVTMVFLDRLRAEWCAVLDERKAGDILLVVSELVTNADRHSLGPYLLDLEGTDQQLAVTVYDSSHAVPEVYEPDPTRVGGHGLEIVRALSTELTVERVPVGKRTRALLDLRP